MSCAATALAEARSFSSQLRRAPPPVRTALARPARIEITGELEHDAAMCVEPATQRAGVSVYIHQDGATDILATVWIGDGPDAALDAQDRAATLRRGTTVRVAGQSLRNKWEHGVLIFELRLAHLIERVEAAI